MTSITPSLGTVQETLLIPLCGRATELQQDTPVVHDPQAAEILKSLDYDFDSVGRYADTMLGCCIRAAVFDGWIQEFLSATPEATVVEIGAGLDTTFHRNDNGSVQWYELDFPDVINLRKQFFTESDRRKFIPGSVLDRDWVDTVRSSGRTSFLFQFAGVFMYLEEEKVRRALTIIADEFPGSTVLFDACAWWAWKNSARWEATVRLTNAEYRWGINSPARISRWDPRFHVQESKYLLQLHRNRWSWWPRFWARMLPPVSRGFSLNRVRMR